MAQVSKTVLLAAPADEVWALVGDYNGLPEWLPGIERSTLEQDGKIRRLTLAEGGGEVVELLHSHDPSGRTCTYSIEESGLPIRDYVSTLTVRESDGGSEVEWTGTFEVVGVPEEEALGIVHGIYDAGIGSLEERFGG